MTTCGLNEICYTLHGAGDSLYATTSCNHASASAMAIHALLPYSSDLLLPLVSTCCSNYFARERHKANTRSITVCDVCLGSRSTSSMPREWTLFSSQDYLPNPATSVSARNFALMYDQANLRRSPEQIRASFLHRLGLPPAPSIPATPTAR